MEKMLLSLIWAFLVDLSSSVYANNTNNRANNILVIGKDLYKE